MSDTAMLYPSGIDKCPWKYRKDEIDGTWYRRPVNTNGEWQALHVKRIGTPPDNGRPMAEVKNSPSIYEWTWK